MHRTLVALLAGGAVTLAGAATEPSDLPPHEMAMQAIEQAPGVQAARWAVTGEEAGRDRLVAGDAETKLVLEGQQRRVRVEPTDTFAEWNVGVERELRLPDKAQLDGHVGRQRVEVAQAALADAFHESGRELLAAWFAWVRAGLESEEWERQTALLAQELKVVDRRIQAGDAAQLDRLAAEAALAQSRASLAQAKGRQQAARSDLAARFPALRLPASVRLAEPKPIPGGAEQWRQDIVAHSHGLIAAQTESRRWQAEMARQSAYERPNPTVGLFYGQERGGDEQILRLGISVPLPGEARAADTRQARAQAESANAREAAESLRTQAQATGTYQAAVNAFEVWRQAQAAASSMGRNATMVSKAYAAGEAGLNELLVARRQAVEATLAARLAQADARASHLRLLLDAHQLWAFEDHGAEGPVHAQGL
jgi:outer membrane protein, heavy metal efflux system